MLAGRAMHVFGRLLAITAACIVLGEIYEDDSECTNDVDDKPVNDKYPRRALLQVSGNARRAGRRDCQVGDAFTVFNKVTATYVSGTIVNVSHNETADVVFDSGPTGVLPLAVVNETCHPAGQIGNGSNGSNASSAAHGGSGAASNVTNPAVLNVSNTTVQANVSQGGAEPEAEPEGEPKVELPEYVEAAPGRLACPQHYKRIMNVSECRDVAQQGKLRETAVYWVASGCFDAYHVTAGCFALGPSVFFHEETCAADNEIIGSHTSYICRFVPQVASDASTNSSRDVVDLLFDVLDKNSDGHIDKQEMYSLKD